MNRYKNLDVSLADGIYQITLNHPPVNTFDPQSLTELEYAVEKFLADDTGKVAIIASAIRAIFSSGADLAHYARIDDPEEIVAFIERGQGLFRKISTSSKPFIAAINGLALGGGLELALACHLRVAYTQARLGSPEITHGIIPGWGGTQMLTQIAGPSKAVEMILLGETISAQEALRYQLVNKVVQRGDVLPTAEEWARKITSRSERAVSAALRSIRAGMEETDGYVCEFEQITALIRDEVIFHHIKAVLNQPKSNQP